MAADQERAPQGREGGRAAQRAMWRAMRRGQGIGGHLVANVASLRRLPQLVASLWAAGPGLASAILVLRLIRALQPPAVLYVAKLIIDEIVARSAAGAGSFQLADLQQGGALSPLAGLILLEFVLVAGDAVLSRVDRLLEQMLGERHANRLGAALIRQADALDLAQLETGEIQDRLQRARNQSVMGNSLLGQMLNQAQDAVTLIALVAGVAAFAPALVLLLAFALLPSLLGEAYFNSLRYGLDKEATARRREIDYIRYVGANARTAKEVKLFGLGAYLAGRFTTLAGSLHVASMALARKRALWGALFGILSALSYYGAYGYIAFRAVQGDISLGELTFLAGALMRLNALFERMILGLTQIADRALYLEDLYSFFELVPGVTEPERPLPFPEPVRQGIVFENVGFRYPGKEGWVLRNLDLTIRPGETVALVGENGAGKTTIVKLMSRLYDPTEGRILIDGIDCRAFALADLRRHVGVIFQDFVKYNFPAAVNIGVGRIEAVADRERMDAAAEASLAADVIARLPAGYDQVLGDMFTSGVELSGGEWQRIAIARAYFRDAALLILDEPTAALDARAEAAVFARFRDLSRGRTAVFISHRFGTVRMADRIVVLDRGGILEAGSHDDLMRRDGHYAALFRLQAEAFQ
ncbi:ABC transporter ATP-binding protein [Pannonibacter tanglangensis]|nr:ABC transporter ATP-binding protein [Pannonibacter sp. XCT-34]